MKCLVISKNHLSSFISVFQGGDLRYIDYDTRDVYFDKVVPAAFQIMTLLMNYERTIKDFGHCGDKGL